MLADRKAPVAAEEKAGDPVDTAGPTPSSEAKELKPKSQMGGLPQPSDSQKEFRRLLASGAMFQRGCGRSGERR